MRRPDLSPTARRILYAVLFEAFGLGLTAAVLHGTTQEGMGAATGAAIGTTVLALVWNYVFNGFWERWEARQSERGRSLGRRIAHAVLFEGGLVLLTVPFLVWWMSFGWLEGLVYDLGLTALFAVYTFLFTWVFDKVFGLPDSARQVPSAR